MLESINVQKSDSMGYEVDERPGVSKLLYLCITALC